MGGYARSSGKTCYAATSQRSLLKQLPLIQDVEFHSGSYTQFKPENMLIYCDPPYQGTTSYGAVGEFNHEEFWDTMRKWSENNTVVISEYNAPDDFECVLTCQSRMGLRVESGANEMRVEKLFKYKGTK